MISVCINTKNRYEQLFACLRSILQSDFKKFEIIVVDQSLQKMPAKLKNLFKNKKIKYIFQKNSGAGRAKNIALKNSRGSIVAFTDDDCIVTKTWLSSIWFAFKTYPEITGLFSMVLPYKPELHKGLTCPCTVTKKHKAFVNQPGKHWEILGYGNNMAFRRYNLVNLGGFRNWLGPGSIGRNGDDAEVALRFLTLNHKLLYYPGAIVYHDRFLDTYHMNKQMHYYDCGEMACYGYFYFSGQVFAKEIVVESLKNSYYMLRKSIKNILLMKKSKRKTEGFKYQVKSLFYKIQGCFIALYFSKADPLLKVKG